MSNIAPVGPQPSSLICPACRANVITRVQHDSTSKTHLIALILCLFMCWPCVCIPYCMDSCRNTNHYCPACNTFLGTYTA